MKKRVNKIPSIAEYFDSIAEKWDLWEGDLNILNQKLKEGLKSFELKKNEWILDVGCGNGYVSRVFLEEGWEGVGIDLNEEACKFNYAFNQK
ncbi:MAG: methyltransferase domain-containing protein, partial [Chitinispirillaceae bacterium]|nr:methyltransferase domain-containing protein [Chitinispirillaceae bacterium]